MNVDVLFARTDSIYKTLGCQVWDATRDARLYDGSNPVIAHPPCRAWGQMAFFAKPRRGERMLARIALEHVRRNGGVLEHPRNSRLWPVENLPDPGCFDAWGGFTYPIFQQWFGHKAEKATFLYICGTTPKQLPSMPLVLGRATHIVTNSRFVPAEFKRPELSKAARERTPPELAEWLVQVAQKSKITYKQRAKC